MSKRWNAATVLMVAVVLAAVPAAAEGVAATATATVRRVVVSIPDRKLAVIEDGTTVEVYDVAVGKPSTPSPVGTFTIVNRVAHPTYYRPGVVIPAGDRNPLGTRWMGLSEKGYGIHGTDQPGSIGYAKSHGCIRLRNADVERLFERLRPGDVVELHAERTPEIEALFSAS
jgi:lipoprotein-anchoring transpeptidase ErfK/SrfK